MTESLTNKITLLLAEFLEAGSRDDPGSFGAFCARHPEHASQLRRLKSTHDGLCDESGEASGSRGTVSEQIKSRFGDDVDPHVTLEPEKGGPSSVGSELIGRLSSRGDSYGRYKLKDEVGRGGQGAVLRVWDEDLRRNLAMKIMLGTADGSGPGESSQANSQVLGRFLEEAQVTGQLDHPSIVPVHELGLDAEGHVYFTMKLVKGDNLAVAFDKVKTGEDGWTLTRAVGVLMKVCEAMAYAHDKGVIHRDLKPANIMTGRFGEVYVMDWGLARVMGMDDGRDLRIKPSHTTRLRSSLREDAESPDSPLVTMDGEVVGTPAYMSPEQAHGELDNVGPRSDVYSFGAVLYHLLAGHMPYVKPGTVATNYSVWRWVQEGAPESLRRIARMAPIELVTICERAMQRNPAERYANMSEVADELRSYLEFGVARTHVSGPLRKLARYWSSSSKLSKASFLLTYGTIAVTAAWLTIGELHALGIQLAMSTLVVSLGLAIGALASRRPKGFAVLAGVPSLLLVVSSVWVNWGGDGPIDHQAEHLLRTLQFDQVIERLANNPAGEQSIPNQLTLARALAFVGRFEEALEAVTTGVSDGALLRSPRAPYVLSLRALMLFELERPEEARDALEDASGVWLDLSSGQQVEASIEQAPEPEIEEPEEPPDSDQ